MDNSNNSNGTDQAEQAPKGVTDVTAATDNGDQAANPSEPAGSEPPQEVKQGDALSNPAEPQAAEAQADAGAGQGQTEAVSLPMDRVEPNRFNARRTFDFDTLKELAQNISTFGLIQPVTVRRVEGKDGGERYEVICGERRYRACKMLKLSSIPAIVREATDEQAYDLSISENLQREDVQPMEAAEAYKRLISTKRYDVKSLALLFGKSEKHVYQALKLCELIPGIADLVRKGKLTASAGIVISKYDRKMQEEILKDRLGEDGKGEWCHISASSLESAIQRCYTNNLADYRFDKSECLKCNSNSSNYDLFADKGGCGKCADKNCLKAKQQAYLVAEAERIAKADPQMVFIDSSYSDRNGSEASREIRDAGYEFKDINTWNLSRYPEAPVAPQSFDYKKPADFDKAQKKYVKEQEQYADHVKRLDALKEKGKIRVYAQIGDGDVKILYKEVAAKDTKTNEQLITGWKAKKERNTEIAKEKTAEEVKTLLGKEQLPKSAFTAEEEAMVYFFMLSKLRSNNYKAVGLNSSDWNITDEKKLKIASKLTEEQKTVIRRDYLHSHLTDCTMTTSSVRGGLMLAFAKLHLPEQTAAIETSYKDEYARKNARLEERITEIQKQMKPAKGDANASKPEKTAVKATATGAETAKTAGKAVAGGKDAKKATGTAAVGIATGIPAKTGKAAEQPKSIAAPTPAPVLAKTDGKAAEAPALASVTGSVKATGQPKANVPDAGASETLTIIPSKIDGRPAVTATDTAESTKVAPVNADVKTAEQPKAIAPIPDGADGKATVIPAPAPAKSESKGSGRPKAAKTPMAGKVHIVTVPTRANIARTA